MSVRTATAIAHPNIALAKYWGKQPFGHNLPAVPSLSVTLEGMATRTTVSFDPSLATDALSLNGALETGNALTRVVGLLDRVRAAAKLDAHARVESSNDFPTASGLASSASAFAALAVAASRAAGLDSSQETLSDLARSTSVSSARSLFGGFVSLPRGEQGDTFLSARQVAGADAWDIAIVVAVTREGAKEVSSSDGMRHTSATSPYFPAWVAHAPSVYARMSAALEARDLATLGEAAEESALAMHAAAIAACPAVVYWTAGTIEAIHAVRALRKSGTPAYLTIDAGPHVKVLTLAAHVDAVVKHMSATPGVLRTIIAKAGPGARVIEGA